MYPTWIRSARIRTFWALTAGIVLLAVGVAVFGLPGLAISVLALPFLYVALVITMTSYRLSPVVMTCKPRSCCSLASGPVQTVPFWMSGAAAGSCSSTSRRPPPVST